MHAPAELTLEVRLEHLFKRKCLKASLGNKGKAGKSYLYSKGVGLHQKVDVHQRVGFCDGRSS